MNKQFIVRKNEEIELIVKRGRKKVSKYFILYYIDSEKIYNQYCVSVSKKLGKAPISVTIPFSTAPKSESC